MGLIKVQLSEAFCEKKGCKNNRRHRHHRGHEFLFAVRWQRHIDNPYLMDQAVLRDLDNMKEWVRRYWLFRPKDVVNICERHHAEIHLIYDEEIMRDNRMRNLPLDFYTYKEAVQLRDRLRKVCDEWMKKETKGVAPSRVFGRARTKNQIKAKVRDGRKNKGSSSDAGERVEEDNSNR